MAEVKWIKIVADIFDNKKIRIIEAMPDGDTIIVVWFKILMLAGSTNDYGYIYLTKEIPYTDQMLATVFNRPLTTVQLALKTFEQFGMIEIIDNIIHISNWEKYQNVEGLDKIREQTKLRVAKHRERKQLEMHSNVCSYCGNKATGYDHIIAIARGGEDVDSNKTPCCSECNRIKNNEPLIDFLNNNRDRINDSLVMGNSKLTKYVTLCNDTNRYTVTLRNVTDRYNVTHGNATDIDIDIDIDKKKNIKKKNFPPTVEEVAEYCKTRGNGIDAQEFIDYYEARSWYSGKTKITDWKRCVNTWERRRGFKFVEPKNVNNNTTNKLEMTDEEWEQFVMSDKWDEQ